MEVARLLGAEPLDVRFTAGATEANNTLLFGLLGPGDHVVTSTVEHPSIDEPLARLERGGVAVTRVPCDDQGCVSAEEVAQAIRENTKLVSIIWANNETGALQPVEEVAALAQERDVLVHSDATQALGKARVDLSRVPLDFISASAHKLGGPKGAGALVSRGDRKLPAYLQGGGQERGLRGGTENVAGIVGFGVACGLAEKDLSARVEANRDLRDRLWRGLQSGVGAVRWNGDPERLLSNTLNVEFEGLPGEVLVQALDLAGVAVSAGAACHSGSIEPSKVLTAMGRTPEQARASLRLSVGWGVDASQVDRAAALVAELIPKIRSAEAP